MTPVKPFMTALGSGVARWEALRRTFASTWPARAVVGLAFCAMGMLVYGGYQGRPAHTPRAEPQPAYEQAVKHEASPGVAGPLVDQRELRLLQPEPWAFERLVMPEGLEALAP